jgi:hypothetical protein
MTWTASISRSLVSVALVSSAALFVVACGGSSSETPPPLEPDPHLLAPRAPAASEPIVEPEPEPEKGTVPREDTTPAPVPTTPGRETLPGGNVPLY